MKNNTNIYDIDGDLIRAADDNHQFTIEEAQERMRHYSKRAEENPEKSAIYASYIRNLSNYVLNKLSKMSQDEYTEYAKKVFSTPQQTTAEDIEKALNDIKNDIETGENIENEVSGTTSTDNESTTNEEPGDDETIERPISDIHEESGRTQSDLLVERDNVNTVMDEYVQFSELPVSNETSNSPIGEASDEYVPFEEV